MADPGRGKALREQLDALHAKAEAALKVGDMDAHMAHGREFHLLAIRIKKETGVDLRPFYTR